MGPLKHLVLLAFILSSSFLFPQAEEETIVWSEDYKLQWADFKKKPFKTAWASAITASGIAYTFSYKEAAEGNVLNITISTHFFPNSSWYQKERVNDLVLSHEQLHFDISELYARKMRKRVAETVFTKNIKEEVKAIYKDILKELNAFQKKYDFETNFSRSMEQQFLWNQKIENALLVE
ncbi:MAG: DUF922 domain-containing protein [Flavobacteriaceae bacterium]